MDPTITMASLQMVTQVEYEPLPWYLANTVNDPDKEEILQCKDLMQAKLKKRIELWKNGLSREFGQLTEGLQGKL